VGQGARLVRFATRRALLGMVVLVAIRLSGLRQCLQKLASSVTALG
jgi:hypothetical protein